MLDQLGPRPKWLSSIALARRTRRDRKCESCGYIIPKGSIYVRHSLPPHSDIGNEHWWSLSSCGWTTGECRKYWTIDSKDIMGELHVIPVG